MDSIIVSIIIPTFNAEKYLSETLRSVINQTYDYWELIIVNDGSSDSTSQIVKKFIKQDKRIKLIEQNNAGQGAARNKGIKQAKGKWIALLDADDLWKSDKLEKQLGIVEKHKVDFVYSMAESFSTQLVIDKNRTPWQCGFTAGKKMLGILYLQSGIVNSSVLTKRKLIEDTGFFDESRHVQGTEDWDLWLRMAKNECRFYGMQEKLVRYRIHEDGIHLNTIRMLESKKAVYKKYEEEQSIPNWKKLRQYRFVYRELLREYAKKENWQKVKVAFNELAILDQFGITTILQKILFYLLPIPVFSWLSQKIIYRLGYRFEHLFYKLRH